MSYLLLLVYMVVLIFCIRRCRFFKTELLPNYIPTLVFLLKFFAGIAVFVVYTHFYDDRRGSDMFKYFDDGNIIYSSLRYSVTDYLRMVTGIGGDAPHLEKYYKTCIFWIKDFDYGLINDNRTVIRFNAIVRLFSMGNIHIHTLIINFISFIGLWGIYKTFEQMFIKQKWALLFAIFLFPSVLFWGSGILKEGVLFFAFGLFVYSLAKIINSNWRFDTIIIFLISVFLLLITKFYVLIAALPGLLFLVTIKLTGKKFFFTKLTVIILLFMGSSWLTIPSTDLNFTEIMSRKQHDFVNYINSMQQVGSKIDIPELKPTLGSILKNTPEAFFRTLFRPAIFEANNAMSLIAAFENLLITLILLLVIVFFNPKNLQNEWLWFAASFVFVLFTLSGLTTPVLGALVRYKAPALPFLGLVFLYLFNIEKFTKLRERLKPFKFS